MGSFAMKLARVLRGAPLLVAKLSSRSPYLRSDNEAAPLKCRVDVQSNSRWVDVRVVVCVCVGGGRNGQRWQLAVALGASRTAGTTECTPKHLAAAPPDAGTSCAGSWTA